MMVHETAKPGIIEWETFVLDKLWFSARFRLTDMTILDSSNHDTAAFIINLLKEAAKLKPELRLTDQGFSIQNFIDFDIRWGLGSSSSLLSNFAYWLDIDPYALYHSTFQGSGYDIFCARANGPVTFQLKDDRCEIQEVDFKPSFSDQIHFIYLGRKQDSQESVRKFRDRVLKDDKIITRLSDLTEALIKSPDIEEFSSIMHRHEDIISAEIGIPAVKQESFPDFQGEIKSLGAWGGDFVMVATKMSPIEMRNYFQRKNLRVIFRWDEIIF